MNFSNYYFFNRESIAMVQKTEIEILMYLHILSVTESKKSHFWHVVCLSVCLSVYTITQKIIELSQQNLVCDLI